MKSIYIIIPFYLFCVAAFTYPSVDHIHDRLIGDGGDNYEYYSYILVGRDNLLKGKSIFSRTCVYRYPDCFQFNLGADAKLFVMVGSLISLITGPVVTYNCMILLIFLINSVSCYFFINLLFQNSFVAVVSGFVYGMSYYTLASAGGYVNILQVYAFPIIASSIVLLLRGKVARGVIVFFAGLLLAFLSAIQYGFISLGAVVSVTPLFAIYYRHKALTVLNSIIVNKKALFFCGVIFSVVWLSFFKEHAVEYLEHHNKFTPVFNKTVNVVSFLRPNLYLETYFSRFQQSIFPIDGVVSDDNNYIHRSLFVGYAELLLIVFLIFFVRFKHKLFFSLLLVLFFILCLGTTYNGYALPYALLQYIFPFSIVLETERWYPIFYLLFVVGVSISLLDIHKKNKLIAIVICACMFLERVNNNFRISPLLPIKPYQQIVRGLQGDAVLDIPVLVHFPQSWMRTRYNHLPFVYGKSIVSGYYHWIPDVIFGSPYVDFTPEIKLLECGADKEESLTDLHSKSLQKNFINVLDHGGIYSVVIHKELYQHPLCELTRQYAQLLFPTIERDMKYLFLNDSIVDSAAREDNPFETVYIDEEVIIYSLRRE